MNEALRIRELVKRGVFGRSTLYGFIKEGRLPARRLNGIVFVMAEDYNRLLDSASPVATTKANNP